MFGKSRENRLSRLHIKDARLRDVLLGRAFLVEDGAMGTMVQVAGMDGRCALPDLLCLEEPAFVESVHRKYVEAGAQLVTTNTFRSNSLRLKEAAGDTAPSVAEVFAAAQACARAAGARYVAADIGPTGELLEPFGTFSFDDAYTLFAEEARAAEAAGCDVIAIETMSNLLEAKAAVLAAVENTQLPVFATMTFEANGRTFLGTSPEVAAVVLSSLGADAVGVNCSLGPSEMVPLVAEVARNAKCPVVVRPNAGLPRMEGGRTVFDLTPAEFAESLEGIIDAGATILGSCCGTNPDFTRVIAEAVEARGVPEVRDMEALERRFVVTSAQEAVTLEDSGAHNVRIIGERINPTGNKRVRAALEARDFDFIIGLASAQQDAGADILDVNVGMPELDEAALMHEAVLRLQGAITVPLCIDSSDVEALEAAARTYAGKPLINSVNGKRESLETVLPIVAKYGCAVIGLTLDESGIPETAEERLAIARRIVGHAEALGIPRGDIVIDCLTMPAATSPGKPVEIMRTIGLIKRELGVKTALGVSNVSFGLPQRPLMNSVFLASALGAGLDLPIIDPNNARYRDVVSAYKALSGQDVSAAEYIAACAAHPDPYSGDVGKSCDAPASVAAADPVDAVDDAAAIRHGVISGNSSQVAEAIRRMLDDGADGLSVLNDFMIPALDEVGALFEAGTTFLPQLLASAEAARAGFDIVHDSLPAETDRSNVHGAKPIVLATVKGDIHDIGKNIVKMLLENYGYRVIDLGKDVEPSAVVAAVEESGASLVGLSALMTTTVDAMRQTIELLRESASGVQVMVGGAVITESLAKQLGADHYAKDAVESTRIAEAIFHQIGHENGSRV